MKSIKTKRPQLLLAGLISLSIMVVVFMIYGRTQQTYTGQLVMRNLPCDTIPPTCGQGLYFIENEETWYLVNDPKPESRYIGSTVQVTGKKETREPQPCFGGEACESKFITIRSIKTLR